MRKPAARMLDQAQTQQVIDATGFHTARANAFAFRDRQRNVVYDWHDHDHHQLLYAISGVLHLESREARFILPPQRAAWVPAGVPHRTWVEDADSASVCFLPSFLSDAKRTIRVIAAPALMREMILHALRWPPSRTPGDALAESCFRSMALLCEEWLQDEIPFSAPRSDDPAMRRAMDYTERHLATASIAGAAQAAAVSERTLRRLFEQELGCAWRDYLYQCRMTRAMVLLGQPRASASGVADEIGFESLSSFIKAFRKFAGETPNRFRQRLRSEAGDVETR